MPISRQIEVMLESRIFIVTKSGDLFFGTWDGGGFRSSSWGWTIGREKYPGDDPRNDAHVTHHSEQYR
jgi:hypothetical protein